MRKLTLTMFLLALPLLFTAAAQQPSAPPQPPAATPPIIVPAYPDSSDGLKQLAKDLLEARRKNDRDALAALAQMLALPEYQAWFQDVFGEDLGPQIAGAYGEVSGTMHSLLSDALSRILAENLRKMDVQRFTKPCVLEANAEQYPVLAARKKPVPFYSVSFTDGRRGRGMWFFVHVLGTFRFLGVIRLFPPAPWRRFSSVTVPMEVQQAKLIHQQEPEYPQDALRDGIGGTVRLWAVIGRDGAVTDIHLNQGLCSLAESAIRAVRKWRYSPTLVDGKPVEVITTIDIIFEVSRR
ncbi:MAG: energy transducer TonB [Acidobacteria bacterium]|nr:energy transducer TonB [Acidobacteriota bacterium]MBI3663898.1 energy transducer TonB [Acidobacteriota bacterium]